jgi:hypothetical protein
MKTILVSLLTTLMDLLRSRASLHLEMLALRQQLAMVASRDNKRIIGSIRRECLNHGIIFNERHLRQVLKSYARYYHEARTHLSLDKQSPVPRSIQQPHQGTVVAFPHVGGLHHEYRRAA